MINGMFEVGMFGVVFGMFAFLSDRKHLLSMLLSLEYMSLSLFFILIYVMCNYMSEDYIMLYYLVLVVCEGVLGLGLIVGMVRLGGNDYFSSYSLLQC